jgi:CubicO group peptidase (beta-lactamase class C family)
MFADVLGPLFLIAAAASASSHPAEKSAIVGYAEHQLRDNYNVDGPGAAVIVARGGVVVYRGARGMGDIEHATPLTPDSRFKIGSITKQFVAAGLLRLVEDGKISLDDPLSKFLPNFPGGNAITLSMLLNHTSGVKNYTDMPGPDVPLPALTTSQLIETFEKAEPDFAPGTSWAYDNSGYVLIGAVIESVTGLSWHDYLDREIFKPLHLTHTGYDADPSVRAGLVRGYASIAGKPTPASGLAAIHADGALVSNVDDLLKWNLALHEGHFLKTESYQRMITPIGAAIPEQYGFGVWHTSLRGHAMIAHSGHISGFSAYLLYLPAERVSVVVLQNSDRAHELVDPTLTARKLAAVAIGSPYHPPAPITMDAAVLRQAEGIYGTDLPGPSFARSQGAHVLRVVGGKLTDARTGEIRSELIPVAVDTLGSRDNFDRLHLERDADGAVLAIRFYPWGEGDGQRLVRTSPSWVAVMSSHSVDHATIEQFVGDYSADDMTLHVFLDGTHLRAALGPTSMVTLEPTSSSTFVVVEVDATLEFAGSRTATLHQGRDIVVFKRMNAPKS